VQQSYQTFGPAQGSIREAIYAWQWALVTWRASQEAARYAAVVAIVKESLDRFTAIQDLLQAYNAPDIGLKSRVLALCGEGSIRLQPQVVLGAACALRLRQLMDVAIA
jgi:hypothetical protein